MIRSKWIAHGGNIARRDEDYDDDDDDDDDDGSIDVVIAPRARSGNWLPTGGLDRYLLMMRLYDTPVGVSTRSQKDAPMPAVVTVGCP